MVGWPVARFAPLIVFLLVFAFLFWVVGHRLPISNNDEGIYLDAGRRVAAGEAPYRDFFYLSGPGTPWAMGLSMRVFGTNLPAARLPLILDLALITSLIFWLARRLSGQAVPALIAAFLFLSLTVAQESVLLANHRWDSGAMALLCVTLAWSCSHQSRRGLALLAGLSSAAATWATPPLALLALTLALWHLLDRRLRPSSAAFLAGGLAGLAAGLALLWWQGALGALLDQMLWIARHYSGANRMFYGSIIGGYGTLFEGLSGASLIVAGVIVFLLALPAWLPLAVTSGWLVVLRLRAGFDQPARLSIVFLLGCGAVLIASQAPRLDVPHLLFSSPLYFALAAALAPSLLRGRALTALAVVCLFSGSIYLGYANLSRLKVRTVQTAVGRASMHTAEANQLHQLGSYVKPGDSLFVFPYRPVLYFALGGVNPTRYSFLQPGMSSAGDEANVLADLRRAPPQWVIHLNIEPGEYLRVWPSSDRSRLRMESIERFIAEGYAPVTQAGSYRLLRRR